MLKQHIVLETERLRIRFVTAEDWEAIGKIWEDFNNSEYVKYDRPHSTAEADVRPRIARWAEANWGMEHLFFAICLQETLIGYIAFNIRENGYEIGYCFHSAYHGKGYAAEAHLSLLRYMKERGISRVTAGTAIKNVPSVRLLEALGFHLIGTETVSFYQDENGNDIEFEGGLFELKL